MSSAGYIPLDQIKDQNLGAVDYGSFGSMNIQSWILFWRFVSGIGIGGDYPLSSLIVSEYAPTAKRSRMLATVFAMQSFGIATGAVVSLIAAKIAQARHPYNPAHPEASARILDQMWRYVLGLGLVPAMLTAIIRFTIPESPRYTLDVANNPLKAFRDSNKLKGSKLGSDIINRSGTDVMWHPPLARDEENGVGDVVANLTADRHASERQNEGENLSTLTIKQYFWIEGNWRYLFATSFSWMALDIATFAVNLSNAQTLSKLWSGGDVSVKDPKIWNSDISDPNPSIFSILISNAVHLLINVCISEITASVLLILIISRINRRLMLWVMFLITGLLMVLVGVTLLKTTGKPTWGVNIGLYALFSFTDQFGGSPLTFMIPAELFPTRYRATCHGISAASGKFGAVLASIMLRYVTFGEITPASAPSTWLSYVLIAFSTPLFVGAGVCWLWIPELQDESGKNKTLEQLARGRCVNRSDAVTSHHSL